MKLVLLLLPLLAAGAKRVKRDDDLYESHMYSHYLKGLGRFFEEDPFEFSPSANAKRDTKLTNFVTPHPEPKKDTPYAFEGYPTTPAPAYAYSPTPEYGYAVTPAPPNPYSPSAYPVTHAPAHHYSPTAYAGTPTPQPYHASTPYPYVSPVPYPGTPPPYPQHHQYAGHQPTPPAAHPHLKQLDPQAAGYPQYPHQFYPYDQGWNL